MTLPRDLERMSLDALYWALNDPRRLPAKKPTPPLAFPAPSVLLGASDFLGKAIEQTRYRMQAATPPLLTKKLIRLLWAGVKQARVVADDKVIRDAFMELAIETNLINKRGYWIGDDVGESVRRYGAEDVEHVIRWALRGWNPFETGPLK